MLLKMHYTKCIFMFSMYLLIKILVL